MPSLTTPSRYDETKADNPTAFQLSLMKANSPPASTSALSPTGELDTLVPAYAATIHKSQGSEYPAVVIPLMTQHYAMLQRNLLYTGVTRGKRLVVLVGQKKAVAIAVRNVSGRRRWSKLAAWLSADVSKRYMSV
jgi:ATP-dependent exoDNAse (exonuclease V) alpha subunit